ncbi:MAG: Bug family tripartite tricarboxylate transporter substrate binding protein [Pigmentiphaga sp.]
MHRTAKTLIATALLAFAGQGAALADYPDKAVRLIVGFPPGTTGDVLVRSLAPEVGARLGQPLVVENRPGAGSNIAAEAVARSEPDGYTVLLSTTANVINRNLHPNLSFDFAKDLQPVALLAEAPALLVAPPSLPAQDLKSLIAHAKAHPGQLSFGSSGNGTFTHLYGELLNQTADIQLEHVPYKGSSQAITDALGNRLELLFTPASTVIAQVKDNNLKALGVIGRQPIAGLPGVPTFRSAGLEGFDSALWFGLNVPAGTPDAAVQKLASAFEAALALPDVRDKLAAITIDTSMAAGSDAFRQLIQDEDQKWAGVVKASGIKVE